MRTLQGQTRYLPGVLAIRYGPRPRSPNASVSFQGGCGGLLTRTFASGIPLGVSLRRAYFAVAAVMNHREPTMYDRILIPTDGSTGTIHASVRGVELAQTFDATIHSLYVVDTRPLNGVQLSDELAVDRAAEDFGRQAVAAVSERAEAAGLDVTESIQTGVPHAEILTYITDNDIDAVVMGTHGRTGAERGALGSTTDRILREADVPVFTVQLAESQGTDIEGNAINYNDILVPTDGSDAAVRAAEHAIGFAEPYGATLHGLYVVDSSIFEFEDAPRSLLGPLREGGQNAVAEIQSMAADASITATNTLAEGRPFEEILEAADDVNAGLIVVGRRGRTGLPEVLLGSTTARLVRLAKPPVLSVT